MSFREYCRRDVVTARPEETVRDAAKRMQSAGVGALAVVDDKRRPVGFVTDRDIVQKVVRRQRDADTTPISDVMSLDIVSVWAEAPLVRAFHRMRHDGVRRVLAVDETGALVGLLTYDDALPLISGQLAMAAEVARAQQPAQTAQTA